MKLDSNYEYNTDEILKTLDELSNKDKISKYIGYRYIKYDDYCELFGWQYTKINIINNHFKLYIFLNVKIDNKGIIKDIELSKNFCGSQGLKCRVDILNKHIKDYLIGEELNNRNRKIKKAKDLRCRHIYEILYGLADFKNYNEDNKKIDNYYLEKTKVKIGLNKLEMITSFDIDEKKHVLNNLVNNISNLNLDKDYNIVSEDKFKLSTKFDAELIINSSFKTNSKQDFYQQVLKTIFQVWYKVNEKINLDDMFSFTVIWPTNYYSFLIELVTVYKKIYDKKSLNKCIKNFQLVDEEAQCLGFE